MRTTTPDRTTRQRNRRRQRYTADTLMRRLAQAIRQALLLQRRPVGDATPEELILADIAAWERRGPSPPLPLQEPDDE